MKHYKSIFLSTLLLACGCTFVGCSHEKEQFDTKVLWSDRPAYTCMFSTEEDYDLTSDVYDNVWEGDSTPQLPRVANPQQHKSWLTGE